MRKIVHRINRKDNRIANKGTQKRRSPKSNRQINGNFRTYVQQTWFTTELIFVSRV